MNDVKMGFNFNADGIELLLSSFIIDEKDCWVWTRAKSTAGYSRFKDTYGHRVVYEIFVADIPAGYELDHLCRNRSCINPEHLEAVLPKVNRERGEWYIAQNLRKTSCPQGHPYDKDNTIIRSNGHRRCRVCYLAQQNKQYLKRKARGYYARAV